jgi:tetratricopeptide (TPR) repeat protein
MDGFTGEGEGGARIRALRGELGRDRLASFFASAEELAHKVSVAVTNQLKDEQVSGRPAIPAGRGWTIPPPVRSFTGRDDQLTALRAQLTSQGAATLVPAAALYGMGGVGKTQLALAYAQRYRGDYTLGWWVPAETELGFLTALGELGAALGLPENLPPAKLAARTRDALGERSGWLLVFDNAPDPATVAEYFPGSGGGHVLVTSRDSAWQGIADSISVDLLPIQDAVELLLRRTGNREEQAATQLAEALGRLPLALEQAAAYTAQQLMPLAEYLKAFRQRRTELLALGRPLAYHGTVDATFSLAREQLQVTNPAAVQLLELCALLAPDELPLPLLLSEPKLLPEPLAAAVADPLRRGEVAGVLYRSGLLTRDVADTARMHRLVQDVTLAHLPEADRQQRTVDAVGLLAGLFPWEGNHPEQWPVCAQLLTHAQILLDHARLTELSSSAMAGLLNAVGLYLWGRGLDLRLAVDMQEQALAMYRRLHSGDNSSVATSLSNLAVVVRGAGDHERARELDEEALAMRRRLYEGDHPDVSASMGNLAIDLRSFGDYERARELDEEALAMRRRLYEGDHRNLAASMGNLAIDLGGLREYGQARELGEQALAMYRRLYEGDHPSVAMTLTVLAFAVRGLEDYQRARELDEEALAIYRRLYEGDHPDVAGNLGSLAVVVRELEDYERARELDEEALAMYRRLYEGDHRNLAASLGSLAIDLRGLGEHERARELDEQALAMRQRLSERRSAPDD